MKAKIVTTLFLLLFVIGFGAGGAFGISTLVRHCADGLAARHWQSVTATVVDAKLHESHGDSTTYKVVARYRYEYKGKNYEGTRVGISEGSDNVGDWQRSQFAQLDAAKRYGKSIDIWVDPKQPERSVVDRNIRWGMVAFAFPFATIFPTVSLGTLWMIIAMWRNDEPKWLRQRLKMKHDSDYAIQSDARTGIVVGWVFAVLWSLIAFPVGIVAVWQTIGRSWTWLIAMLFPLAGVALLWGVAARTLRLTRNGPVAILLDPLDPRVGNAVSIRTQFARVPRSGSYRIRLLCERVDTRGDDTSYRVVWDEERTVRCKGKDFVCSFTPPVGTPASEPEDKIYHRWRVILNFPDGKDERGFNINVEAADEEARLAAADAPIAKEVAAPIPDTFATISDRITGLTVEYHEPWPPGTATAIGAIGVVFIGIGGFIAYRTSTSAMAVLMGIIFSLAGAGVICGAIYMRTHRRKVDIDRKKMRVVNRWLFNSRVDECAIEQVTRLVPSIVASSGSRDNMRDHYRIKAIVGDTLASEQSHEIVLASDIRDAAVAVGLMQLFQKHLDLPDTAVASIKSAAWPVTNGKASLANTVEGKQLKRAILIAKGIAMLLFLAFVWDVASSFLFTKDRSESQKRTGITNVLVPQKVLSEPDQALFSATSDKRPLELLQVAFARGANIETTNASGFTALEFAARSGKVDVVEDLVRRGANVNHCVTEDNDYAGRTALMNAALAKCSRCAQSLLDAGATPITFEKHGWSALHYAAYEGDVAMLRVLSARDVPLDPRSPAEKGRGETPLMIAARKGRVAAIQELIKLGADPRARDRQGENVYGWAKFFNQPAAMAVLKEYE